MFDENNETNEMDNERVIDVPGQQTIPLAHGGGVYIGSADEAMERAQDHALALMGWALGGRI